MEPGHPITVQWPLVVGGDDGFDPGPGAYTFVAELNTHAFDLQRGFVIE